MGALMLKLYSYFRSSASYRVRIALHVKNLPFEYIPVHLVKDGGAQNAAEYRAINAMGHVPALVHDGFVLAESMAIIQYLDDISPALPLFPSEPRHRAQVMQLCEIVNSGIQPLQNLKVQKLLETRYRLSTSESRQFIHHWIQDGLSNLEKILAHTAGSYAFGADLTAADCFIIPQCLTAVRFGVDVSSFPNLHRVNENALKLAGVLKAHPEKQPDFQK